MRPLHIVHTEASLGWGGQEIRILNEAKGIAERGHRVTIICPSDSNIYRESKNRGIDTIALPIGRKKLSGLWAMKNWLKQNKVDIINTHSSTDSWLAALACKFLEDAPKIVRTRHISAPVPRNMATNWLYTRATEHIVTTGEKLRNQLIDRNGFNPKNITSVPTGINTELFSPGEKIFARERLGLPINKKIIGILATLRSWKGHSYLLEAFKKIADENVHLLIVGDGPQKEAIKLQSIQLGLESKITMPGNQDNVVPWLQAMDIFVLPSYANEGVPQAILQAMSCGLPVISTDIGSITEAVLHQETGIIVPTKDSDAISEALQTLLKNADMRQRFGDIARKMAQEKFGQHIMVNKMENIFDGVLSGK